MRFWVDIGVVFVFIVKREAGVVLSIGSIEEVERCANGSDRLFDVVMKWIDGCEWDLSVYWHSLLVVVCVLKRLLKDRVVKCDSRSLGVARVDGAK